MELHSNSFEQLLMELFLDCFFGTDEAIKEKKRIQAHMAIREVKPEKVTDRILDRDANPYFVMYKDKEWELYGYDKVTDEYLLLGDPDENGLRAHCFIEKEQLSQKESVSLQEQIDKRLSIGRTTAPGSTWTEVFAQRESQEQEQEQTQGTAEEKVQGTTPEQDTTKSQKESLTENEYQFIKVEENKSVELNGMVPMLKIMRNAGIADEVIAATFSMFAASQLNEADKIEEALRESGIQPDNLQKDVVEQIAQGKRLDEITTLQEQQKNENPVGQPEEIKTDQELEKLKKQIDEDNIRIMGSGKSDMEIAEDLIANYVERFEGANIPLSNEQLSKVIGNICGSYNIESKTMVRLLNEHNVLDDNFKTLANEERLVAKHYIERTDDDMHKGEDKNIHMKM